MGGINQMMNTCKEKEKPGAVWRLRPGRAAGYIPYTLLTITYFVKHFIVKLSEFYGGHPA